MANFYNPRFDKHSKGKYSKDTSFLSIKGGTDAYLLEDELNELQWIQSEARRYLVKNMTNSGCLEIVDINKKEGLPQAGSVIELGTKVLNSFSVKAFNACLDGRVQHITSTGVAGDLTITLPEPSNIRGTDRHDLVYLEFWESEVAYNTYELENTGSSNGKNTNRVHYMGGVDNDFIDYDIIDKDMAGIQTSRRVQFQWAIRVKTDIDINMYPNGFINSDKGSNPDILAKGPKKKDSTYWFKYNLSDSGIYIAGDGDEQSINDLGTIDGYSYAIPLFMVYRLNSGGYDEVLNINGSNNYIDETSIPENDGKYSNVVYKDQIVDLRVLAYLNPEQYKSIFVTYEKFEEYKTEIEINIKNNLDDLTNFTNDLHNYVHNVIKPDLDLKAYITDVNDMFKEFDIKYQAKIDDIYDILRKHHDKIDQNLDKINEILLILDDHEKRLKRVEDFLIQVGYDPELQDFLKYGINMRRREIMVSGGTLMVNESQEEVVVSPGTLLNVPFVSSDEYVCASTIYQNSQGMVGDIWFNKADTSYLIKNTGSANIGVKVYDFANDGSIVRKGFGTFTGGNEEGVVITVSNDEFSFVHIAPLESTCGENGDVSIALNGNNIIVNNTGNAGNRFEWFIVDISKLRNVELIDINLDGSTKVETIMGNFGEEFDVLLSPVIEPIAIKGTIGEFHIAKAMNSFSVTFTGSATCKFKALVFKEVLLEG